MSKVKKAKMSIKCIKKTEKEQMKIKRERKEKEMRCNKKEGFWTF